jgi:hypothetical protein
MSQRTDAIVAHAATNCTRPRRAPCLRCDHRLPESIPTLLGLEHVCTACRDAERQAQLLTRLNENLESSQEAAARARENARDDNERIFRALEDDRQEREQAAEDQLERMEEMQEDFLEQQQENIANRWRLEAQSRADQAHAHFRANRYREAMRLAQQAYADTYSVCGSGRKTLPRPESMPSIDLYVHSVDLAIWHLAEGVPGVYAKNSSSAAMII